MTRPGEDGTAPPRAPLALAASTLVLGLATFLCVFRSFALAYPGAGLDAAWTMVIGEAARLPARWGVDIAFTYGPASALTTRYFTDSYFQTTLPLAAALSLVIGFGMSCLALLGADARPLLDHDEGGHDAARKPGPSFRRHALDHDVFGSDRSKDMDVIDFNEGGHDAARKPGPSFRRHALARILLGVAAFAAALLSQAGLDPDGLLLAFGPMVLLLDLKRPRRHGPMLAAAVLGAAALGVAGLCKTSYGVAAAPALLLGDARALGRRRVPVLTVPFLAAFSIAFLAHGQRLADLPAYLRMQGEVAAGYGEAMYLAGSRRELVLFLVLAAALPLGVAAAERRLGDQGAGWAVAPLGLASLLLVAFKIGFIRQDTHPQIAWGILGFLGVAAALGVLAPRAPRLGLAAGGAALLVLWVLAPAFLLGGVRQAVDRAGLVGLYGDWLQAAGREGAGLIGVLADPARALATAEAGKAEALARLRRDNPLPKLEGTVDMLGSDQGTLIANGLRYHPRPSFAEYTTYTAGLIAANAAFYAGDMAPDWVMFDFGGLDERYPAMTEGALWPDLLRRYEPVTLTGAGLALHRRAVPLPDRLGPARAERAVLGEPRALDAAGPVFARITLHPTPLGRLLSAAFRPPALVLRVRLADGQDIDYRYIPALGAGGFLLSPMVDDPREFAGLAFGLPGAAPGKAVRALTIGGSPLTRWFYDKAIDIELRPLRLDAPPPSAEAAALHQDLRQP